jgi:integrase
MALDIVRDRLSTSPDDHLFEQRPTPEGTSVLWRSRCDAARKKAGAMTRVETQHSTRSTFRTLSPRMAPTSTPAGVIEAIMGHEIKGAISSATKHYLRAFEPDAHAFMANWRPAISIRQCPASQQPHDPSS